MDLCIAGLPISVESADRAFFDRRYAPYRRDDSRESVLQITTRVVDPIPQPKGELVQTIKKAQLVRTPDGRLCRYICSDTGDILFAIYTTPDYARTEIQLTPRRLHPTLTATNWEYMYTGFAFQNRLMTLGGVILHSSSLAWRGQGIAFSAPCGTGKSTHVGLWKQRFGADVEIINDDKPAIRFEGEQPMLYGTPWSGKTDQNSNRAAPLRAIVFLERGETNSIRRLGTVESMLHLTDQISRPYYDAALGEKSLDCIERLMQTVPIYMLRCNISQEAVDTVFEEIFGKEVAEDEN